MFDLIDFTMTSPHLPSDQSGDSGTNVNENAKLKEDSTNNVRELSNSNEKSTTPDKRSDAESKVLNESEAKVGESGESSSSKQVDKRNEGKFDPHLLKKISIYIDRRKDMKNLALDRSIKDPSLIVVPRRSGEGSKPIFDRPELKAALNRQLEEEIGKKHKYDKRGRSKERSPYYKRHRSRSTSSERKHRYRSTDDGEKRGRRRSSSRDRFRHMSEKRKHQRETSVNKNKRSQSPSTSHKSDSRRRSRSRSRSSSSDDSDDYKKQIAKPSRNRDYHQDYNIPPEQWMMRPRMFIPHPYPPPPMMYPPMMAPYRPRFPPRPRPPAKQ